MTDKLLKILDEILYWETCPEDYKKEIKNFLEEHNEAFRPLTLRWRSEQLDTAEKRNIFNDGYSLGLKTGKRQLEKGVRITNLKNLYKMSNEAHNVKYNRSRHT